MGFQSRLHHQPLQRRPVSSLRSRRQGMDMLFLPGVIHPDQQGAVIATQLSTYRQFMEPAPENEQTALSILTDLRSLNEPVDFMIYFLKCV